MAEHGSKDAVTIRGVAQAVGVTAPSIYLHFADKDDLLYETCRRVFDHLNTRLVEALADADDSVIDRLMRAGRAYIGFGLDHPGQYVTLFGPDVADEVPEEKWQDDPGVAAFGLLVGLIQAGMDSGELKGDLDIDSTAVSVWAAVHGTVNILITKRGMEGINIPPDDDVIDATLRMLLEGLAS